MNQPATASSRVRVERRYEASVEDLWALWTTKDGFESWWGPEGFRVEVHALEARFGGRLDYDMIAVGEEQIAYMDRAGLPRSHETHGTFTLVEKGRRLTIQHVIDFIEGVEPYDNVMSVDFEVEGPIVTMVVTIDPHFSPEMTAQATAGFESQLRKLASKWKVV